jgi:acetyl-CoA acetyltransferase
MESMSRAPYYLPKARDGQRLGHGQLLDGMIADGLWDVYEDFHMGNTGELVAEKYERQPRGARQLRGGLASEPSARVAAENRQVRRRDASRSKSPAARARSRSSTGTRDRAATLPSKGSAS